MSTPHPCSDHHGEGATPWDMPIPRALKEEWKRLATRRHFLRLSGATLGGLGLASLMGGHTARAQQAGHDTGPAGLGQLGAPHATAGAKRVISLFMAGGPPHMDMLDYKPELAKYNGQDIPASILGADFKPSGMTAGQSRFTTKASPFGFKAHGATGRFVSDALPWTAKMIDELAIIHSMYSDAINHEPAIMLMNTSNMVPGRPALGSWVSYGLGSANADLPSFVVLNSNLPGGQSGQPVTPRLWSSSFLPTQHAGVALRSSADSVLYLKNPDGMSRDLRRTLIDGVAQSNERTYHQLGDAETHARIAQYEMAFNMQMSVPELSDLSSEPQSTWDLYGPQAKVPGSFAYNCLMARRLAERGVRFTQVYQRGWDFHGGLHGGMNVMCGVTDRPAYALVTDLKRRGLLDDTLVVWGGEFGRTTYGQGDGRDHHAKCFTAWLAGGGTKAGATYGATDDFAFNIANPDEKVHPRDLISTICQTLGIDAKRLSKRVSGVDLKPFGVIEGKVLHEILA